MWKYRGQRRPQFAERPMSGQESVWDYPRPSAVERCDRLVEVRSGAVTVAHSTATWRVLETASPPGFYIPEQDVDRTLLVAATGRSLCEWKGIAEYWSLAAAPATPVAWSYPDPSPGFEALRGCLSFYPGRVACYVDSERVRPQPGPFYGGWVTDDIAGPVKGGPGTGHW